MSLRLPLCLIALTLGIETAPALAQAGVDCTKLDPRASVATSHEGKVSATVETLYKIAKAGGAVEGKVRNEVDNLQKEAPLPERGQVALRTIYVFCGMVANATDISTERKVQLYQIMVKLDKEEASRPDTAGNRARPAPVQRQAKRLDPPKAKKFGVLVDLSHGQTGWESRSVFAVAATEDRIRLLREFADLPDVELATITDPRQISARNLQPWRGLILGIPWKAQLSNETIAAIKTWVDSGGRLLLLGFELGDRHHEANLNALAHLFGIHFNTDIVAPRGWGDQAGPAKPYGALTTFAVASATRPLLEGISALSLRNVQSLNVEPGSVTLLSTGQNEVGRLRGARYQNGQLAIGNQEYDFAAVDAPVAALAAPGLAGRGAVLAIGTWELLDRHTESPADNRRFVKNIVMWLAGH